MKMRSVPETCRVSSIEFAIAVLVMCAASSSVDATELSQRVSRLFDSELEGLFWHCDFVATKSGVGAEAGAVCASVTDELLRRRFLGNYGAFIAWWQDNKSIQRAARAEDASRLSATDLVGSD